MNSKNLKGGCEERFTWSHAHCFSLWTFEHQHLSGSEAKSLFFLRSSVTQNKILWQFMTIIWSLKIYVAVVKGAFTWVMQIIEFYCLLAVNNFFRGLSFSHLKQQNELKAGRPAGMVSLLAAIHRRPNKFYLAFRQPVQIFAVFFCCCCFWAFFV